LGGRRELEDASGGMRQNEELVKMGGGKTPERGKSRGGRGRESLKCKLRSLWEENRKSPMAGILPSDRIWKKKVIWSLRVSSNSKRAYKGSRVLRDQHFLERRKASSEQK